MLADHVTCSANQVTVDTTICVTFQGSGTLGRFSAIFDKGDNFCDILFAFLYNSVQSASEKRSLQKERNLHPLLKRGLL